MTMRDKHGLGGETAHWLRALVALAGLSSAPSPRTEVYKHLCVTWVPVDPMLYSGLRTRYQAYMVHILTCKQRPIHIKVSPSSHGLILDPTLKLPAN